MQHDLEIKLLDFNNYQLTVIMKVIHSIISFSPSIALSLTIVSILLQDTPTGIGASVNAVPFIDVRLESHQLSVSGNGLKNIKLYQISGSLLKQSEKINGNQASLSLQGIPAGIYLLRIVTDKQTFTYPIRIRGAR